MSIERKPSTIERNILLAPIRAYINYKYNLEVKRNDTIGLQPPYIILGNHVTNWDPLFINCHVDDSISFVAAASTFQNPMIKKVLDYTGAISKTKSQADSSTIRNIMKAIKHNRVVCIFPEGNRTWNGQTEPIVFATSKLVRSLGVPVVVANIRGGYLSHPRWSASVRKAKVELELKKVFNRDDLKALTPEQIHETLARELHVDDYTWQQRTGVAFNGKNLAHHLERYLFTCPACTAVGKMHSTGDEFTCQSCGYKVRYTNIGTFAQVNGALQFEYIYDWNEWQLKQMAARLTESAYEKAVAQTLNEKVLVTKLTKENTNVDLGEYTLQIEQQKVMFIPESSSVKPFELAIRNIDGANIFKQKIVNFLYEGEQYHISFKNKRASAYLFITYVEQLKEHMAELARVNLK